jgi:hypothetical protein
MMGPRVLPADLVLVAPVVLIAFVVLLALCVLLSLAGWSFAAYRQAEPH